ncbi:hypothetical protein V1514DRAFT_339318 [Lipomyces japonicus]|uniref:uncharacterized protein n=1 Tax=Lipomyces japonicus TaxID=56871 RepID=UPI0034D01742
MTEISDPSLSSSVDDATAKAKFEFKAISSAFPAPVTSSTASSVTKPTDANAEQQQQQQQQQQQATVTAATTSTTSTTTAIATDQEQKEQKERQENEKIIAELHKIIARKRRFGQDASEIEKILTRGSKFAGGQVVDRAAALRIISGAKIDKPLTNHYGNTSNGGRGYRGGYYRSHRGWHRDSQNYHHHYGARRGQSYNTSATTTTISEAEKEKLQKRQDRFAGK